LADRGLRDSERKAVADAILAIHQTRSAWQASVSSECSRTGGIWLTSSCTPKLIPLAESLNLRPEIVVLGNKNLGEGGGAPNGIALHEILHPFLSACLSRIQTAIDLMSR
jgi:hypothetical protein